MSKFLKSKLVLASVLAGAMAFGTACKSHQATTQEGTSTDQTTPGAMTAPDAGTGGAGDLDTSPGAGDLGTSSGAGGAGSTGTSPDTSAPDTSGTGDLGTSSGTGGAGNIGTGDRSTDPESSVTGGDTGTREPIDPEGSR